MLLGVAAHRLRVVGVGTDFLRERQNSFDINGALVGGELEDLGKICGEVRITACNNIGDPTSAVLPSLQFRCLRQSLPVDPEAPHRDMTLVKERVKSLTCRETMENYLVTDAEVAGKFAEVG